MVSAKLVSCCSCLFYVCRRYDDETDQVMKYQRIPLKDLDKIEIGSFDHIFSTVSVGIVDYLLMFYDVYVSKVML